MSNKSEKCDFYACTKSIMFLPCPSQLPSRAIYMFHNNTEQISIKFVAGNHYHSYLKLLHFFQEPQQEQEQGSRIQDKI